eukprot:Colp12_sorted_trinity150504_noHs@12156
MRPFTLVSHNTYLIPGFMSAKNRNNDPHSRARMIGDFIRTSKAQLAFMQEIWGSSVDVLEQCLTSPYKSDSEGMVIDPALRVPAVMVSGSRFFDQMFGPKSIVTGMATKIFHAASTVFQTGLFHWKSFGGLYYCHSKDVRCVWSSRHRYETSATKSGKGVHAVLMDVDAYWPGKHLLVFNTHLDAHNNANKLIQLQELRTFMQVVLTQELPRQVNLKMESVCVVLLGDFNIRHHEPDMYNKFFEIVTPGMRDLHKDFETKNGFDKPGEHHTYEPASNPLADCPGDTGRIDYIFAVDYFPTSPKDDGDVQDGKVDKGVEKIEFSKIYCVNFQVVKEPVMSDHWPLLCTLVLKHQGV